MVRGFSRYTAGLDRTRLGSPRLGKARPVLAWLPSPWHDQARLGGARRVKSGLGSPRLGEAPLLAWHGRTRRGLARPGSAPHGSAALVTARPDSASPGSARPGMSRLPYSWRVVSPLGKARRGFAPLHRSSRGGSWQAGAGQDAVWRDMASL